MTHKAQGFTLDDYPHVKRWYAEVRARLKTWIPEYMPPAGAPVQPIPVENADVVPAPLPLRAPRRR